MTDREQLLSLIRELAVVHGRVTLSSGKQADYYVDLRRITLHGGAAPLVGSLMLELTADLEFDAVGGMTMGADPIAAAMLHASAAQGRRLDAFVIRKEAKAHGLQRRIEGPDVAGRRLLVVEDTTTTGGTPLTALAAGLHCRPVEETVVDTWAWVQEAGVPRGRPGMEPGLPVEVERALLQ